jgi:hypothetical protein
LLLADIDEEVGEELRSYEALTCGYTSGNLPSWIFFEPYLVFGTDKSLSGIGEAG